MYPLRLSSAGLVYKHFGQRVIAQILGWDLVDPRVEVVYQKIYDDFVLAVGEGHVALDWATGL